jgi:DNA-binding MarR family transcriptional regulator
MGVVLDLAMRVSPLRIRGQRGHRSMRHCRQASGRVRRLLSEARFLIQTLDDAASAAPPQLSMTDWRIIDRLSRSPGPVVVRNLANATLTLPAQLLEALRRLRSRGWLEDLGPADDAASLELRVALSGSGRKAWRDNVAERAAAFERLALGLDADSLQVAAAVLHRMRQRLIADSVPRPADIADHFETCRRADP